MTLMRVIKEYVYGEFPRGTVLDMTYLPGRPFPWVYTDGDGDWRFAADEVEPVTPVPVQITVDGLTPEAVREIVLDLLREHGLLPTEAAEEPIPDPAPAPRRAYVEVLERVWEDPAAPQVGDILPMTFLPQRENYPWRYEPDGQDWFYSATEVREVPNAVRLTKDVYADGWFDVVLRGTIGEDIGPSATGHFRRVVIPGCRRKWLLLWPGEIEPAVP